jgi:Flp pilus assembly protein TadG
MPKTLRGVRRLVRDTRGSVAVLFGLAVIPILLGVGVAVDYGRALIVRERMSSAADAAALAIGSWTGLTQAELKTKAQQYFKANYPSSALGAVGTLNVHFQGDDILVDVTGSVPTTFMRLANVDSLDIGVSAVITKRQRNIELTLVLDTTGSMAYSGKMDALQSAAKKMVQDLFQDQSTSETLKVAVVPFSGAVNIGTDKLDWLDLEKYPDMSLIAGEDFDFENGQSVMTLYDDLRNRKWAGCVRERDEPYALTDDPPTGVAATRWAPYFAPDEPDSGYYANNYIDDGNCGSSGGWGGWGGSDPAACQRYTGKYENTYANSSSRGPQFNCPPRAITPLTNIQEQVTSAIEALQPSGSTVIPAGLLWGWRVLSPGAPFTEGAAFNEEKLVKALVLLTDGQNDIGGGSNGHNKSFYNAFGYSAEGHLGSTSGYDAEETLNSMTMQVCQAIKAQGILVYTIGFQVNDSTTQNLLRSCATQPDMYYNSPSNSQLASVFKDIAQGLSNLRIAK